MSSNNNQNNKKIIQFKDIISILLVILIISLSVCGVLASSNTATHNNVTARNLAMFASLAYADLENINAYANKLNLKNKTTLNVLTEIKSNNLTFNEVDMVTDEQLKGIYTNTELLGLSLSDENENTYDYLFYGLASTDEVKDWKIVNYTKFDTTVAKGTAQFAAMTFKKDNDIVIAYRGTDFDDIGDWLQDLSYGLVGYAGQEGVTQDYARLVADHYAKNNKNIHIYVTGHSLGGYLAQIGGAALAEDKNYVKNLKEVSYFNGMGLNFWSNIVNNISTSTKYTKLKENSSQINTIQDKAQIALTNFKNNGGKIISYHINGDIVSSLGTHVGTKIGYDAYDVCIEHHNGYKSEKLVITKGLFKIISPFLNEDISEYIDKYRPATILDYVWITHETDSFFGVLPAEPTIKIEFKNVPTTIKRKATKTIQLDVTVINGELESTNLKTSDFTITNKYGTKIKSHLTINSISNAKTSENKNSKTYTFNIEIKGGTVIGTSKITLRKNALKAVSKNKSKTTYSTAVSTPDYINTKLK